VYALAQIKDDVEAIAVVTARVEDHNNAEAIAAIIARLGDSDL